MNHILLLILALVLGFVALIKGADLFVEGSAALARRFHVPGLIIGLTIVAMGTSAPELAISTLAAVQGSNEIALSNVVGSNLFNILVVLGVCSVITPLPVSPGVLRRDFPVSILFTVFVLAATGGAGLLLRGFGPEQMREMAGRVTRLTGVTLLVSFVIYITFLILEARKHPEIDPMRRSGSLRSALLRIILGLALIVGGGQAVVYGAKGLARAAGMTETLIGLTVVAVGTSLPELVTSIAAARKGETALAIGNVVGSNIFNLLFILGTSATIHPLAVNGATVFDLAILLGVSVLLLLFSLSARTIRRGEGMVMLALYGADLAFAILR